MRTDPVNRFVVSQISRHRVQKRITVADLAQGTGIPMGSLSCLLTGRYKCSLLNLYRILAHMGVGILEVWPEAKSGMETVNAETIQAAVEEAQARVPMLVSIEGILSAVSRVFGVSLKEIASASRERHLSEARAVATYLVSGQSHLTVAELSKSLRRDTSGLFHVTRRMQDRLAYDESLLERLKAVQKQLLP